MQLKADETSHSLVTPAPFFFSLACGEWVPYALTWDPETGALRGVEGPRGSASYRAAVEASRFLRPTREILEAF